MPPKKSGRKRSGPSVQESAARCLRRAAGRSEVPTRRPPSSPSCWRICANGAAAPARRAHLSVGDGAARGGGACAAAEQGEAVVSCLPHLGPRKLLALLDRQSAGDRLACGVDDWDILKRAGLISPVKRRRVHSTSGGPAQPVTRPNDEWSVDFKGWFRTLDLCRIDPLTMADSHSRFLIELRIVAPTTEGVVPVLRGRSASMACHLRSAATMVRPLARVVQVASPNCRPGG